MLIVIKASSKKNVDAIKYTTYTALQPYSSEHWIFELNEPDKPSQNFA